ncbi:MAG: hypothetical protein PHY64_00545, partial [Eubacteriales bacterium]|nr:hypothetical protein [Eubacteriales bacterium]
ARRLDPARLGDLYTEKPRTFYPLDNGAKQYPLVMRKGQMAMFRLTATLAEPADPVILQLALHFVLHRFPHYATRMRKGAFWYYLQTCRTRYIVSEEQEQYCQAIDLDDDSNQLFRVMYRENRVSVELFHILADGTGGLVFLKTLLAEYYRILGENPDYEDKQILDTGMPSLPEDTENGFWRFRESRGGESVIGTPAIQLPAVPLPENEHHVDIFAFRAEELAVSAHKRSVSVTELLSAVILSACRETAPAEKGRYQLQVPINLRKVFPSATLRNYSWFCSLSLDAAEMLTDDQLLLSVSQQLRRYTERETLRKNVSVGQRMIRFLRYVPLQWKSVCMGTAYQLTGDFFFTTTLSNIGLIPLPPHLASRVTDISIALGPSLTNPYNMGLATCGDWAMLTVTRTTADLAFEKALVASARAYGLTINRKG